MGFIVNEDDFKQAPNKINFNSYQGGDINAFISQHEKAYLSRILGLDFANLFIADLVGGVPINPLYLDIFNPLEVQYRRQIYASNGLVSILKGFIKAEYVKELQLSQDPTGSNVIKSENSNAIHESFFIGYNEQIIQGTAIQVYCKQNSTDYPDFSGEKLETISPLW